MPKAQDEDGSGSDLVTDLIVANDDPANLTRQVGIELLAETRVVEQPVWSVRKVSNDPRRRLRRHRAQVRMQPHKIGGRPSGPLGLHGLGGGNGASVARLSAQALIA